jgi:hypothetical protein
MTSVKKTTMKIVHAGMGLGMKAINIPRPVLYEGPGSSGKLKDILEAEGKVRPLIVTSPGTVQRDYFKGIMDSLLENKFEPEREALRTQIVSLKDKYRANKLHAKVLRQCNQEGFAKRHEALAEQHFQKLHELQKKADKVEEKFKRQYSNIAKNDTELMESM